MTESATLQKPDRIAEPEQLKTRDAPTAKERDKPDAPAPSDTSEPAINEVMRPVWVQEPGVRAHRPFIQERPTQWQLLLPRSRAGIATVVVGRHGGPGVLGVRTSASRWSLFWQRGSLYEIDLGLHHTTFELDLPSAADLFSFRAQVTVEWRVIDPVLVVQDHVCDIREALGPALTSLLALDTRGFRVDEVYAAERAVAAVLHNNDVGTDYGLATMVRMQLSADSGAAEHAASRRALQQKIEIEELQYDHRMLLEVNEEKVVKGRIRLYREIIEAGDIEQFALQLARNPNGVEAVNRMVREVRQEEHRHVTDFLTRLLESGSIDRWEIKDTVQTALDWLKESNDRVVQTGEARIPWQRPAPYAGAGNGAAAAGKGNGTVLTKQ